MPHATVLFVALLILHGARAFKPGGEDGCACIDAYQFYECAGNCTPTRDYGARGCKPYDLLEGTFGCGQTTAGDDVPSWCSDRWCYVRHANCSTRPNKQSSYAFELKPELVPSWCGSASNNETCERYIDPTCDRRLYYSYETCGNVRTLGDPQP